MNAPTPIARAMLDMVLLNDDLESVLRLGGGPQTLFLELANLSDQDFEISAEDETRTVLRLTFRPGTLDKPEAVMVASERSEGWSGRIVKGEVFHTLELTWNDPAGRAKNHLLKAGAMHRIAIDNLVPSAASGSRATRVEVAYANLKLRGRKATVDGRRIVHLSLLQAGAGAGGQPGPIRAQLFDSSDVVIGKPADKDVVIDMVSDVPMPVVPQQKAGTPDDSVSRITVWSPNLQVDVKSLLPRIGEAGDSNRTRWQIAGKNRIDYNSGQSHTLRNSFLEISVRVDAGMNPKPGIFPVHIEYENFGDEAMGLRRGRLTIQFRVTVIGANTKLERVHTAYPLTVDGMVTAGGFTTKGDLSVRNVTASGDVGGKNVKASAEVSTLKLEVRDRAHFNRAFFGKNWNLWQGNNSSSNWVGFYYDDDTKFFMTYKKRSKLAYFGSYGDLLISASKVGIGVDKPERKLHVDGDFRASVLYVGTDKYNGGYINLPHGWAVGASDDGSQFQIRKNGVVMAWVDSRGKIHSKG